MAPFLVCVCVCVCDATELRVSSCVCVRARRVITLSCVVSLCACVQTNIHICKGERETPIINLFIKYIQILCALKRIHLLIQQNHTRLNSFARTNIYIYIYIYIHTIHTSTHASTHTCAKKMTLQACSTPTHIPTQRRPAYNILPCILSPGMRAHITYTDTHTHIHTHTHTRQRHTHTSHDQAQTRPSYSTELRGPSPRRRHSS
jgi:hypothetical protein